VASPKRRSFLAAVCVVLATVSIPAQAAEAERKERLPPELEGVGVTPHPDARLPLDLAFVDSDGRDVTLGQFFDGKRPVILTMNYSNCPRLCSWQLNGLVNAMRGMPWDLGRQFQIVTVIIDPNESPQRAGIARDGYLRSYHRGGGGAGWHFLTGHDEDIKAVAAAVGFGYRYVPEPRQYVHPAVLILCTPDGRVSRYLGGIKFDPQTLRLALVEASEGKAGTAFDQVLLYCFHYDPDKGRYGPAAFHLMQLAGGLTVVVLGGALALFWRREARKRKPLPPAGGS
jgi:protein SCO1/2